MRETSSSGDHFLPSCLNDHFLTLSSQGVYTYLNGDVFEGVYDANLRTGLGKVTYAAGRTTFSQ